MRQETIENLAILLNSLRSYEILSEVRPTNFHLNGKGFIHFHDESDGLWADIFLSKGRLRMPVNTASEQAEVIGTIEPGLESLESGAQKRKISKSRTNRGR
jgi:hypothetical protein